MSTELGTSLTTSLIFDFSKSSAHAKVSPSVIVVLEARSVRRFGLIENGKKLPMTVLD